MPVHDTIGPRLHRHGRIDEGDDTVDVGIGEQRGNAGVLQVAAIGEAVRPDSGQVADQVPANIVAGNEFLQLGEGRLQQRPRGR